MVGSLHLSAGLTMLRRGRLLLHTEESGKRSEEVTHVFRDVIHYAKVKYLI